MLRLHSHDLDSESQVDFLEGESERFQSVDDFYAAAIKQMWEGSDTIERIERYIANAEKRSRTPEDLKSAWNESRAITPLDGVPAIEAPEDCHSFRDDWNIREFVWRESGAWRMFSWETSA